MIMCFIPENYRELLELISNSLKLVNEELEIKGKLVPNETNINYKINIKGKSEILEIFADEIGNEIQYSIYFTDVDEFLYKVFKNVNFYNVKEIVFSKIKLKKLYLLLEKYENVIKNYNEQENIYNINLTIPIKLFEKIRKISISLELKLINDINVISIYSFYYLNKNILYKKCPIFESKVDFIRAIISEIMINLLDEKTNDYKFFAEIYKNLQSEIQKKIKEIEKLIETNRINNKYYLKNDLITIKLNIFPTSNYNFLINDFTKFFLNKIGNPKIKVDPTYITLEHKNYEVKLDFKDLSEERKIVNPKILLLISNYRKSYINEIKLIDTFKEYFSSRVGSNYNPKTKPPKLYSNDYTNYSFVYEVQYAINDTSNIVNSLLEKGYKIEIKKSKDEYNKFLIKKIINKSLGYICNIKILIRKYIATATYPNTFFTFKFNFEKLLQQENCDEFVYKIVKTIINNNLDEIVTIFLTKVI